MSQNVMFTELAAAEFRPAIAQLVAVYSAAMNPPERMLAGRKSILEHHAANPGFRAFAAYAADELAGFTYGFHGASGQWWHDMVAGGLAIAGRPTPASWGNIGWERSGSRDAPAASAWLRNSFEVAELHVLPRHQGNGIGRSLLLRLLSDRPERTALLSTADTESRARRLYRGVGFTDLLTGFRFSGLEPPYAVMGATLPLPRASQDDEAATRPDPVSPRPSIS